MKWISSLFLVVLLMGEAVLAYEEPQYVVVDVFEEFEIRRYASYIVAETDVEGDFEDVGNKAFRILADYIFGNNRASEKMEMTVPVNQKPAGDDGERMAMIAPVLSDAPARQPSEGIFTFSFVMPSKYTLETLPRPVNPRVSIRKVPEKLVAVRQFSGFWSKRNYRKNETKLLEALREADVETTSDPLFARYNAPFTPWFLRRNEVLVEIAAAPSRS